MMKRFERGEFRDRHAALGTFRRHRQTWCHQLAYLAVLCDYAADPVIRLTAILTLRKVTRETAPDMWRRGGPVARREPVRAATHRAAQSGLI